MAKPLTLGAVGFAKASDTNTAGWALESILGRERIELLTKAMNKEELPDGLFLVGQGGGSGYRRITHEEVDWDQLVFYLAKYR